MPEGGGGGTQKALDIHYHKNPFQLSTAHILNHYPILEYACIFYCTWLAACRFFKEKYKIDKIVLKKKNWFGFNTLFQKVQDS
jgi:hypothetical protein